jgi:hypothetical protein
MSPNIDNLDPSHLTQEELFKLIAITNQGVEMHRSQAGFSSRLFALYYKYDERLKLLYEELSGLKNSSKQSDQTAAGRVLEKIAYLAFLSIHDNQISPQSYQSSVGPQIDLLVRGESDNWLHIAKCLYIEQIGPSMLVECKAWKSKIEDHDFSRLCVILDHNFPTIAGLGVFFTIKGASGFPDGSAINTKDGKVAAKRAVSNCYLRQLLFHASKRKFIVVFDETDLMALCVQKENLLLIIRRKIEEIEANTGLPTGVEAPHVTALDHLPEHLAAINGHGRG